jgi:hypothetical protein
VCALLLRDGQSRSAHKNGGLSPEAGRTVTPKVPKTHALWKTPPEPVLRSATPHSMEAVARTKAPRNRGQYGLLNRQEAAAALGISVKSLDALTRSGRLRTIHMTDRIVRFWPQDLEAFVTGRSERED